MTATTPRPPTPTEESGAGPAAYHGSRSLPAVRRAAFTSGASAQSVLGLEGLAGPQPGSHDAIAASTLTDGATLTVKPNAGLLSDKDTVFPVFIDPSFSGHTNNWTTAYEPYPTSSFWNGTNFNDGTDTARVGYESSTRGLSRSFFQLQLSSKLKGAAVSSGDFYAKETYSWSCSARSVEVWHTGSISSATTWNKQPSWIEQIDSQNVAHGYNSSCPDNWVKFNAKSLAQDAADNGWGVATVGLRADDEGSAYPWKKFEASSSESPYLKIVYNRKPNEPTKLTMTPGPDCDVDGESTVGKSDLTFAATATDPDGDLKYLDIEVWENGNSTTKVTDANHAVDANGHVSITLASSRFTNGKQYWWRVRAIDSTGAASTYAPPSTDNCGFVYDATKPNSPDVASTDYPKDDGTGTRWSKVPFGTAGNFTFSADGTADTVKYQFSFNSTSYAGATYPASPGASVTISVKPHVAGPNIFYVRAVDSAGNTSDGTKYFFYVTPRDHSDTAGDVTGDDHPDLFVTDEHSNLQLYPGTNVGDIHASLPAALDHGKPVATGYWAGALITHNGDLIRGDGLTDMIARMPDGNLYIYPGDGYGSLDVTQRTQILLPDGAPDPAALNQILATTDIDHDGRPDMLALAGTQYWAFLGYTGGAFSQAVLQNTGTAWNDRDLVSVGDHNNDKAVDLVFRTRSSGKLTLRYGITDSTGGTTLRSLANAAFSLNGSDTEYAPSGWTPSTVLRLTGTPDANTDGIPDIWAIMNDGTVRYYHGGTTTLGTYEKVISADWTLKQALG